MLMMSDLGDDATKLKVNKAYTFFLHLLNFSKVDVAFVCVEYWLLILTVFKTHGNFYNL
jgi:hypothetical protein